MSFQHKVRWAALCGFGSRCILIQPGEYNVGYEAPEDRLPTGMEGGASKSIPKRSFYLASSQISGRLEEMRFFALLGVYLVLSMGDDQGPIPAYSGSVSPDPGGFPFKLWTALDIPA